MHLRCWPLLLVAIGAATAQDTRGRIEGQVLGPLGEPAANVEVWATSDARSTDVLDKTRSDAEGMFVLAGLPARPTQVLARAPRTTTASGYARLDPEQPVAAVRLRLWDANTLRGRVADRAGNPIANALVLGTKDQTWFDGDFLPPEARTDRDGRFELAGVPIGDCVLRAYHDNRAFRVYWLTAVADADITFPPLVAEEATTLTIETRGLPDGLASMLKARIYATSGGTGFRVPSSIERPALDANGRVELRGLPDAEWHVELEAPGVTFDPRSAVTKLGERVNTLVFQAKPDGSVKLSGTLRDAEGKPLGNEVLICRTKRSQSINGGRPGRTTTADDGRFVMDAPLVAGEPFSLHLADSKYVLAQPKRPEDAGSQDPRYRVRWEDQVEAGRELALVAERGARVHATAVDTGGRPVAFAWSELQVLRPSWTPEWLAIAYATSSRTGELRFPSVPGGGDELRIMVNGAGASGASTPFGVAAGKQRDVDVVVPLCGKVAGRALDAKGQPLAGVRVSLRDYDTQTGKQIGGGWTNVPTDREGRFVFAGVMAGGHRVDIDRASNGLDRDRFGGTSAAGQAFDVAPGATAQIELRAK